MVSFDENRRKKNLCKWNVTSVAYSVVEHSRIVHEKKTQQQTQQYVLSIVSGSMHGELE